MAEDGHPVRLGIWLLNEDIVYSFLVPQKRGYDTRNVVHNPFNKDVLSSFLLGVAILHKGERQYFALLSDLGGFFF